MIHKFYFKKIGIVNTSYVNLRKVNYGTLNYRGSADALVYEIWLYYNLHCAEIFVLSVLALAVNVVSLRLAFL